MLDQGPAVTVRYLTPPVTRCSKYFNSRHRCGSRRPPFVFNEGTFTAGGVFEYQLQGITKAARFSRWQIATTDNRPFCFALRFEGNTLLFYTTLTVAQQKHFDQLVATFRATFVTNAEVLQAKLKAAKQQPDQTISAFLCDVGTLGKEVYRAQPAFEEQMVLTSFIEGLHDPQLRWELQWKFLIPWCQFRSLFVAIFGTLPLRNKWPKTSNCWNRMSP